MSLKLLARLIAYALLGAIVVATLGPVSARPHTDMPLNLERAAAFLLLGAAFAVAYPRQIWWAVLIVLVGAVGLELLQNFRPDRHGREMDAAAKIGGALIGLGIGWLVAQVALRFLGRT